MLGLTFFSASMWTGGTLGTSLHYDDFWTAILIGNLMLGVYTACLGYIGAKTGLTTHILARYSFWGKRLMVTVFIAWWNTSWLVWCWGGDVRYSGQ